MIRLNQTQHIGDFSRFELRSGESEDALEAFGSVEVKMHGSMGLNGTCTVFDKAGAVVQAIPVVLGDSGADTLRSVAVEIVRGGFPNENDVV
jgi:hypothetical protein